MAKTSKRKSAPKRDPGAAGERVARSRRASGVARPRAARTGPEFQPPPNDHLSAGFQRLGLVPERYRGTDQFLDIVTWNIRFFHDRDRERVDRIVDVLAGLNADIIVLQEIMNQSLEVVARELARIEAGYYETAYGTTGGNQRVALLYDLDWIRAKDDIKELFGRNQVLAADGKDAFPRLPLYASFTGLTDEAPFDFQLLGLHLKSQRGGGEAQREKAARTLANWLVEDAPHIDADVIVLGDWNAPPNSDAWQPFHELEDSGQVAFQAINNKSEISHLMYHNRQNIGSRLDLGAVSMSASELMGEPPTVVNWAPLEELLEGNPKAQAIKDYIATVRRDVSDHLPVVTRFYFKDERG